LTNCELQVRLDSSLIHTQLLDLPVDSVGSVGKLTHRLTYSPCEISLTLSYNGEILSQNRYDLSWAGGSKAPFSARLRRWVADWLLR
jgi:hypothetical protein